MDEWPGVTGPRVLPAYGRERASEGGVQVPRLRAVVSPFAKGARQRLSSLCNFNFASTSTISYSMYMKTR